MRALSARKMRRTTSGMPPAGGRRALRRPRRRSEGDQAAHRVQPSPIFVARANADERRHDDDEEATLPANHNVRWTLGVRVFDALERRRLSRQRQTGEELRRRPLNVPRLLIQDPTVVGGGGVDDEEEAPTPTTTVVAKYDALSVRRSAQRHSDGDLLSCRRLLTASAAATANEDENEPENEVAALPAFARLDVDELAERRISADSVK